MNAAPIARRRRSTPVPGLVRAARAGFVVLSLGLAALASRAAAEPVRDYLIAPGDVLRVNVYQSPDLTLEARVSESGTIGYPLLGSVKLGGLSAAQAEAEITRGLREGNFLKQPQVTLQVLQVRGNQVSVLGLVNRPGRYPLDMVGMRLSELLALAGGVAAGGSDVVTLTGRREGRPYRQEIDLPALYGRQPRGEDPLLQHGDVVFVDRSPLIYVYGEVQRPGAIRLEREMNVMQALAAGGGLTLRGTDKGLRVHRRNGDGRLEVLTPAMDERLRDGDVLFVREALF